MSKEAQEVRVIVGQGLACMVCEHTKFFQKDVQLNTSLATFLGIDWINRSANCYICERCGYIHWFAKP